MNLVGAVGTRSTASLIVGGDSILSCVHAVARAVPLSMNLVGAVGTRSTASLIVQSDGDAVERVLTRFKGAMRDFARGLLTPALSPSEGARGSCGQRMVQSQAGVGMRLVDSVPAPNPEGWQTVAGGSFGVEGGTGDVNGIAS